MSTADVSEPEDHLLALPRRARRWAPGLLPDTLRLGKWGAVLLALASALLIGGCGGQKAPAQQADAAEEPVVQVRTVGVRRVGHALDGARAAKAEQPVPEQPPVR